MKALEILTKARKLLSDPSRWCRCTYAKNKRGEKTSIQHPDAYQFCMSGALRRVAGDNARFVPFDYHKGGDLGLALMLLGKSINYLPNANFIGRSLTDFNDDVITTHGEIIEAFDGAIKLAKDDELAHD